MTENFKIASKESVAFDLMNQIGRIEKTKGANPIQDRKYWLTLYFQCIKTIDGQGPKASLKEDYI